MTTTKTLTVTNMEILTAFKGHETYLGELTPDIWTEVSRIRDSYDCWESLGAITEAIENVEGEIEEAKKAVGDELRHLGLENVIFLAGELVPEAEAALILAGARSMDDLIAYMTDGTDHIAVCWGDDGFVIERWAKGQE